MITENYVSFEIAKLLKEKGFNEKCRALYTVWFDEEVEGPKEDEAENWNIEPRYFSAPTLQMAMKWLREKHKITIGILFKGDRIYCEIHQNNEFVFGIDTPESYEKVCDEAVKYCLKILVKNDTGR